MAILDEESLLATCAYIDLNRVAAGIAAVPEDTQHTLVKQRVAHVQPQGRTQDLKPARQGSVAGSRAAAWLEKELWLCPVEDRRRLGSPREGIVEGFTLGNYLLLVDYTGRLFRNGKAAMSRELAEILDRLGSTAESWRNCSITSSVARRGSLRSPCPMGTLTLSRSLGARTLSISWSGFPLPRAQLETHFSGRRSSRRAW